MKNQSRNQNIQSLRPEVARTLQPDNHRRHWGRFLIEHSELEDEYPDMAQAVAHTDKQRRHTEDRVSENYARTGRCYATEAEKWYLHLGSTNSMEGATDLLLRAGMIMQKRAEQRDGSKRDQLLSGCLMHEAALTTNDPAIRDRFYLSALDNYRPLIEDESVGVLNINRQLATRHSYDVLFQQLFDRGRVQIERGDYDLQPLEDRFVALQEQYIEEFLHLVDQCPAKHIKNGGDRYGFFKGIAFEWFSVAAYRHALWRQRKFGEATIRTAFPREDTPLFTASNDARKLKLPKSGFDVVIQRYDGSEPVDRELIQLKVGKSLKGSYLPEIKAIGAHCNRRTDFIELLSESAEHMRRQYRGERLSSENLAALQSTFEMVQPELVAA